MSKDFEINEKCIRITVTNFNKKVGYLNNNAMILQKQQGKEAEILYPSAQTLELTKEQEELLLKFINSL